jgi:hypothetical protein
VRQVALPPPARRLSTLFHADYEDAFLVETGQAESRTAEQWARAILEGAPGIMQSAVAAGWFALGLRFGSTQSDDRVLGWVVRRSSPDFVLLGASSRIGMPAEVLFKRHPHALLFATFVQHENLLARAVWAGVAPVHRQVVRQALEQVGSSNGDRRQT